jgi:8-oxo-dGTP diphosphatase
MSAPIRIAAAVIRDRQGRLLLVRKRGTSAFMQPGGKIHANESALAALAREVIEELGCRIRPQTARFLGQFAAPAANEAGKTVLADLFAVAIDGDVIPAAEIEEVVWVDAAAAGAHRLAPLTREWILPLLLAGVGWA